MRRTRVIVTTLLAASTAAAGVVAAGVGLAGTPPPKPGTQASPIGARDQLRGAYTPARITVRNTRAGVTIYFRSLDGRPHNATPVRRIVGAVSPTSTSSRRGFTLRLPRAYRGTFSYFCTVHLATMGRGQITVTG